MRPVRLSLVLETLLQQPRATSVEALYFRLIYATSERLQLRFVARRLGFFVVTLWACLTINFFLPRMMPGNPAYAMMSHFRGRISPNSLHALEVAFGINTKESLPLQYVQYLRNCSTGNFGTSITFFPESVTHVVFQAMPWTLGLVGLTTVLAFLLGTIVGIVSAWRRGSHLDGILPPLLVLTSAFPYFFVAIVFVYLFALTLKWFPLSFAYSVGATPMWSFSFAGDVITHAGLPALTILITSIGAWVLTMRNNMLTTLSEDYVRMARAKGLSSGRIMLDYAARNAILPSITGFAIALGFVVSGAILVEFVFAYPGVGDMLLQAVQNEDYPLMQALFLFITVAVLVAVLVMDFATAILDPRTRSDA
jgi:peptide/nickel transport system permease protein